MLRVKVSPVWASPSESRLSQKCCQKKEYIFKKRTRSAVQGWFVISFGWEDVWKTKSNYHGKEKITIKVWNNSKEIIKKKYLELNQEHKSGLGIVLLWSLYVFKVYLNVFKVYVN